MQVFFHNYEYILLFSICQALCGSVERKAALHSFVTRYNLVAQFVGLCVTSHGLCFLSCSDLRNQSETCAGCIVSCTTATRCSLNEFKSTSSRNVELKFAMILAASYLLR